MTETFIRIAAGHYRNVGTGVEIVKVSADEAGQRGWHVTTPTVSGFEVVAIGATMREVKDAYVKAVRAMYAAIEKAREEATAEDRLRVVDMAADASMAVVRDNDHAEALAYDEEWVRGMEKSGDSKMHNSPSEIDAAHGEALAIDAERTDFLAEQGDTEDDDLIHLWAGDRTPSACGVDIWTTPYTYGSPELDEVTCDACKGREQHRQFVARVREHRTANGGGLIENRRVVIDNDHAEALIAEQAARLTNAQAAQQAADELHDEALLMDAERTAERSSVFAAARMIGDRVPTAAHREALGGFREHGEPVWFKGRTWTVEHVVTGEGGRTCLTLEVDDAAGPYEVRNVYADDVLADNHDEALREQTKRDAVQIIAGARAPFILCALHGSDCRSSQNGRPCSGMPKAERTYKPIAPGAPEVPADLDDDAAWAAYCAALPPATDRQIADVLAEYGDPYAALRAEVVGHYKDTARMAWKIRTREYDDTLKQDLIIQLQATMRTLRGVVETYDMLTESWRLSVRAGTERDAATQTF